MAVKRANRKHIDKHMAQLNDAPRVFEGFIPILPRRKEFAGLDQIIDAASKSSRPGDKPWIPLSDFYKEHRAELSSRFEALYGLDNKPMGGDDLALSIVVVLGTTPSRRRYDGWAVAQTVIDSCRFDTYTVDEKQLGVLTSWASPVHLVVDRRFAEEGEEAGFFFRIWHLDDEEAEPVDSTSEEAIAPESEEANPPEREEEGDTEAATSTPIDQKPAVDEQDAVDGTEDDCMEVDEMSKKKSKKGQKRFEAALKRWDRELEEFFADGGGIVSPLPTGDGVWEMADSRPIIDDGALNQWGYDRSGHRADREAIAGTELAAALDSLDREEDEDDFVPFQISIDPGFLEDDPFVDGDPFDDTVPSTVPSAPEGVRMADMMGEIACEIACITEESVPVDRLVALYYLALRTRFPRSVAVELAVRQQEAMNLERFAGAAPVITHGILVERITMLAPAAFQLPVEPRMTFREVDAIAGLE